MASFVSYHTFQGAEAATCLKFNSGQIAVTVVYSDYDMYSGYYSSSSDCHNRIACQTLQA